jgi:serine protease Do
VLKTDCTLVGGDSGGPLFDMSGNVIGIHSRIGGNIEDNMHVPVDTYSEEWDKFEKSEVIGRSRSSGRSSGRLGFSTGIKLDVLSVSKGGAAEKAGLKVGDVIIKFKDTKIKSRTELRAATRMVRKGQEIEFTVKRGDKEIKIKIKAE